MDERRSYETSRQLLKATNYKEIQTILQAPLTKTLFSDPLSWQPYGNNVNNWPIIGNQQSSADGALAEIITNAIDAVLMDAWDQQLKTQPNAQAPQTMQEAIDRFFPESSAQTSKQTKNRTPISVLIRKSGLRDKNHPTITIVDEGCGANPDQFHDTFVSLGRGNKVKIPFVQGQYNMGSSGSIRYCTQSDQTRGLYKFILSRPRGYPAWGWTLIRIRPAKMYERLPLIEYFAPNGSVPQFCQDYLELPGPRGANHLEHGTIVQLYEYDLSNVPGTGRVSILGSLAKRLPESAIPIAISEMNDAVQHAFFPESPPTSVYRRIGQAVQTIEEIETSQQIEEYSRRAELEYQQEIICKLHQELGKIKITCLGFSELPRFFAEEHKRILLTINGQTHASLSCGVFNRRLKMGELQNHLIVLVNCDALPSYARSSIFMPDRERKAQSALAKSLEEHIYTTLERSASLKRYANKVRARQVKKLIEHSDHAKDLIEQITKIDPKFADMLAIGKDLLNAKQRLGNLEPFNGKEFPTFLERLHHPNVPQEKTNSIVGLPGTANVMAETDAENGYLDRSRQPGKTVILGVQAGLFKLDTKLHNGLVRFRIAVAEDTPIGCYQFEVGFMDASRETPLTIPISLELREAPRDVVSQSDETQDQIEGNEREKTLEDNNPNTHKPIDPAHRFPDLIWVKQAEWREHGFNRMSGARLYNSVQNNVRIFINEDNAYLNAHLKASKDSAAAAIEKAIYQVFMGASTLSLFRHAIERSASGELDLDEEDVLRMTSALSMMAIPIIRMCSTVNLNKTL